jgi:LCP family protein required for cell wall assembly
MVEPAGEESGPVAPAGRPRRRRYLVLTALLLLVAVPAAVGVYAVVHLETNLSRLEGVFEGLPNRPPAGAPGATNILVLGTDRGPDLAATSGAGDLGREAARSDTVMLVHLDADRHAASVVSIPRDTRVEVPGHGTDRIGAAFTLGGTRLGVETVEHLTGVRVDHVAVVDWSRFGALVDAVGGINVGLATTVRDPDSGLTWPAGQVVLDGPAAVRFVRQTAGLPGGELDRIARQHAVLRALAADALHQEMRKEPLLLYRVLDTMSEDLAVDTGWSAREMATLGFSMRDLRSAQISYVTMPVVAQRPAAGSALVPEKEASRQLWDALSRDRVGAWEAQHPDAITPPLVN